MYCPNCGANLADTLNFCTQCGTKLKKDQPAAVAQQKQPEEPRPMANAGSSNSGGLRKLQCELCGSTDMMKQDGFFTCQHCGCKYSLEEARKMMIEGRIDVSGSTIQIDVGEEFKNLLLLAKNQIMSKEYISAEKTAEMALTKNSSYSDPYYLLASVNRLNKEKFDYNIEMAKSKNKTLEIFTEKDLEFMGRIITITFDRKGIGKNVVINSMKLYIDEHTSYIEDGTILRIIMKDGIKKWTIDVDTGIDWARHTVTYSGEITVSKDATYEIVSEGGMFSKKLVLKLVE